MEKGFKQLRQEYTFEYYKETSVTVIHTFAKYKGNTRWDTIYEIKSEGSDIRSSSNIGRILIREFEKTNGYTDSQNMLNKLK